MTVSEVGSFVTSGHAGDFAFAPDMFDCFGPWGRDFDEDVVLEDLRGFAVDLVVDQQDVQVILVAPRLLGSDGIDLGVRGREYLAVYLLANFRWKIKEG